MTDAAERAVSTMLAGWWAAGERYEPYVGRWSRLVAREFVSWLAVPAGADWLDVGSGTGALSTAILDLAAPQAVTGIDASPGFVRYAAEAMPDPRATFEVGDALALPFEDDCFVVAVSGLVLNFVNDPARMVAGVRRVVRCGGIVAVYVWDYSGGMEMMRHFWDAAGDLSGSLAVTEAQSYAICQPAPLRVLFEDADLRDVEVRAIDVPTVFQDFDDYWQPFLSGQAAAPNYAQSLGEEDRAALREALRRRLPTAADGSIALTARAWAVRGMV